MTQAAPPARVRPPVPPLRTVLALALDIVLVLAFVLIGRSSHTEAFSVTGMLTTWWPFLLGLAVGWLATRAWRYPFRVVLPGIPIWLFTVAVGMLFRLLSGQGVAVSFVVVAVIVLGVFLLGWRLIANAVVRRRGRQRADARARGAAGEAGRLPGDGRGPDAGRTGHNGQVRR